MATGVLIVGVGKGTKHLQTFLNCTKTYEATILFGTATDTYDILGKVLGKAPYGHITQQAVEEALKKFRGDIKQRPPLYSALRMDGKRLYEYAREGIEIPREIQERPVRAEKLGIREWLPGGSHQYVWPTEEADDEERDAADKVLHLRDPSERATENLQTMSRPPSPNDSHGAKRRRESEVDDDVLINTSPEAKRQETFPVPLRSGAWREVPEGDDEVPSARSFQTKGGPGSFGEPEVKDTPPAAKLSMTVTSGFYVRSLCHDLGQAVGSLGIMSELVRTRQADFELGKNVLEYEDLRKGEDIWAPKVEKMLEDWQEKLSAELLNGMDGNNPA